MVEVTSLKVEYANLNGEPKSFSVDELLSIKERYSKRYPYFYQDDVDNLYDSDQNRLTESSSSSSLNNPTLNLDKAA